MKEIIVDSYYQNALSLREILDILNINVVDKNKPILDAYPRILTDDGMGINYKVLELTLIPGKEY